MSTVYITTSQLGAALRAESVKMRKCVDIAVDRAIRRWAVYLSDEPERLGIKDTGAYGDGFKVTATTGRATVENDHPAAGVIELGCAPHPVSIEGQAAIKAWCMRKLGLEEKEASRATYLICRKIREHGQPPQYVVRNALPRLLRMFQQELHEALRKRA